MASTGLFDDPKSAGVGTPVYNGTLGDPRVEWIIKKITSEEPRCNKWKRKAREAYRFRDGKQLSEEDERALESEQRPNNAFNAAQKFVRYVSGVQRDSPTQLLFQALSLENDQAQLYGDMLGKYYDWAMSRARGTSERSRAFEDFLVTGMGWSNVYIDRTVDPRGLIGYDRISPLEMIWPQNDKGNLGGSFQGCTRWRYWERDFDNEEAKALFPSGHARFLLDAGDSDAAKSLQWPSVDRVAYKIPYIETYPLDKQGGEKKRKGTSRIGEFQWWENETGYLFLDPLDQSEQWMKDYEFEEYNSQLKEHFGQEIEEYDAQPGRKWMKAFLLNRRHMLEKPSEMAGPRFSLNCMCTHYDEWDKEWYGFFRVVIDPQKYGNKFFNQLIEIMAKQAKVGAMFEDGAFDDAAAERDFQEEYSITGSVQRLAAGGLAKVRDKPVPQLPQATMAIIEFCVKAMDNVTGINEQSMGLGGATQAGVMMKRRQRAGMVLLASEFDAEDEFRKEEGYIVKDHLQLLAEAGGDSRLIRVVSFPGQQPGEVMSLSKAPFSMLYDIGLDEVERDPNQRQFLADWIMSPAGMKMFGMGIFPPEWLDILPFPRSWILHMKQAMQQKEEQAKQAQAQGLPAPGQRGKTKPLIELQALVRNKDADTMLKQARAAELTAKAKQIQRSAKGEEVQAMLESMGAQAEADKAKLEHHTAMASNAIDLMQQAKQAMGNGAGK